MTTGGYVSRADNRSIREGEYSQEVAASVRRGDYVGITAAEQGILSPLPSKKCSVSHLRSDDYSGSVHPPSEAGWKQTISSTRYSLIPMGIGPLTTFFQKRI